MSGLQDSGDWFTWISGLVNPPAWDKVDVDRLSEDMYSVLVDKTENEAWLRVKSVISGNGLEAFVKLYKWFTGTSGQGLSERARAIMAPTPPKTEGDIAEAVGKWIDGLRILESHPGYSMHVNLEGHCIKATDGWKG